ncbi:MAG: hypothetical protein A2X28_08990 [Elusimicrobia bacterium GWA2_56_46]|nr:MAG: hypothetical protein A2X28_08990 [Elusimicrobia bacterium GWA2_56_46]OGR54438.1 MAG: hypothetical protein A2X39_04070 [Elusimicrobia bacterium GWC2_56_31]HBB67022.1 hypothetical protein [Elusimicrobiota bacterium]HBW22582.1 hypothetical protein [Elusimicrobiota bacterium]
MDFKTGKIIAAALILSVLHTGALRAGENPVYLVHPYTSLEAAVDTDTAALRRDWYGEYLQYEIYWGLINVGSAYIWIDKIVTIDGRPAYHIISGAKSAAFIRNFYSVSDINESWMDVETLYSRGYYKKIQEGGYFFNEWVIFDNEAKTFRGEKMNKKRNTGPVEGTLEGPVSDVLSALYLVRTMEMKPDTPVEIAVNTKRNWRMNIKFRKREKESTAYGKFKCVMIEPQLGDDGLFVAKKGKKMLAWITDDELRLPLILKAEIFIGSVTAKLVKREIRP